MNGSNKTAFPFSTFARKMFRKNSLTGGSESCKKVFEIENDFQYPLWLAVDPRPQSPSGILFPFGLFCF